MGEQSVFDNLAGELSADERRDLLDRVRRSAGVSGEPLLMLDGLSFGKKDELEEKLARYSLLERVFLFLRRLFTGRDLETIIRDDDLRVMAKSVEERYAGLIDWRRNLLLEPFLEELHRLRDSARFFYDVLERSFDRDKASFFGFLASFELPETHADLLVRTNPKTFLADHPEATDSELRQAVLRAYDEAFAGLPDDRRRKMYQDLRCLLFLKRLASFLFERCANLFKNGTGPAERAAATFSEIREHLVELGDILFSLSAPPSVELVECLFAFAEHESLERLDENAETLLRSGLGKAEAALGRIRSFNSRVPFFDLIRLVTLDPDWRPQELPAAEDWLVVYRGFWKTRIERQLDELRAERKYQKLSEEMQSFIGEAEPVHFANITREEEKDSPPIRQDLSLAFIDAFARGAFARELNRPLKIVLMDGEFYRKENRIEYTDAYNTLLHCEERVQAFDARLGIDGDLGKAWIQSRREASPLPIRRRKIQSLARGADEEAEKIVRETGSALAEIVRIIRGILKGDAGGRYDSLANLSYIDGKANKEFLKSLAAAKIRVERALGLLSELSGLTLDSPGN